MQEVFEYRFTKLDPIGGDHIDPPSVAVYETLLRKSANETPAPGLASSWSSSEDGLTWRLEVREGARFHSGEACDAAAVVAALERCRWGDGLKRQLWYWDPVDTVRAAGERTVELRLHYPYSRLPTLLWGTHTAICNVRRRAELGEEYGVAIADGTGPYALVSYSPELVVARRATNPGAAPLPPGAPEEIRWISSPEEAARRDALGREDIAVVRAVEPDWLPATGGWRYVEQPEISQFYLALNFDSPLGFGDGDMRRALEAFLERDRLVAVALGGRGDGRRSPVPAGHPHGRAYDAEAAPRMSRAEASGVLDRLGWERAGDGPRHKNGTELSLECLTQDTEVFRRIAEEVARQLSGAGMALRFRYEEPFVPFYRAAERRPEAVLSKWLWPDAIEAVMGFSQSSCAADSGGNWQNAQLPDVDETFARFLRAGSQAELLEASRKVQEVFMAELPYIPLCAPMETYAVAAGVEGFSPLEGTLYPYYEPVVAGRG
jgi:peptide/nickel transport system substrate-binding protein